MENPTLFIPDVFWDITNNIKTRLQDFGQFIFPYPKYIMTEKAELSAREHENSLGYNVTTRLQGEIEQLQKETLTVYKNAFTGSIENVIFMLAIIFFAMIAITRR